MKTPLIPTSDCHYCAGTGVEIDHIKLGSTARKARCDAGIALRRMAAEMKITPSFLSDLERGRRNWTVERIGKFREVMKELAR